MTTVRVASDKHERSGRFQGQNRSECGIHSQLAKLAKIRMEAKARNQHLTLDCNNCFDILKSTFESYVLNSPRDVLLLCYSPFCDHCIDNTPKYAELASALASVEKLLVARMDFAQNFIPDAGKEKGFLVYGLPTLYLYYTATTDHDKVLVEFLWQFEAKIILRWLQQRLPYLHDISLTRS